MLSLVPQYQRDVPSAFNDIWTIVSTQKPVYDTMVPISYPKELKLHEANTSGTSVACLD